MAKVAAALSEPLLSKDDNADDGLNNIPPLNAEDPLFGLKNDQVTSSREVFGKNEIVIPETPLWKLFLHQFTGFLVSVSDGLFAMLRERYYCTMLTFCIDEIGYPHLSLTLLSNHVSSNCYSI